MNPTTDPIYLQNSAGILATYTLTNSTEKHAYLFSHELLFGAINTFTTLHWISSSSNTKILRDPNTRDSIIIPWLAYHEDFISLTEMKLNPIGSELAR